MSPLDPSAHARTTAVYQVPAELGSAVPVPIATQPRRNRAALVIGLAFVALFALLSSGFLVLRAGSSAATTAQASGASATSSGPGTTAAHATTVPADPSTTVGVASTEAGTPGNGGGTGTGTGTKNGGASTPAPKPSAPAPTTAPKPAAPAPQITSFLTPDSIDCHNTDSPLFSASWTTTNAVKTTIAIDGPGIYKTYGPNGSDSLPFNCSTPHTFKLTAFGADGHIVSKTITLQPRNVRPPATPDTVK